MATFSRFLLLPLVMLLALPGAVAQQDFSFDRVYLQGGNMLQGTLKDTLDAHYLHLIIPGADSIVRIPVVLVEKVKTGDKNTRRMVGGRHIPASGWYGNVALSYLAGQTYYAYGDPLRRSISLQAGVGRYLRSWLSVGVGTGIDYYSEFMVPVYAEVKALLPDRAFSPYVSLQAGYGIAAQRVFAREDFDQSHGGFMWQPSIGVRLPTRGRFAFHLDLGYKFQRYTLDYDYPDDWWWQRETERIQYRSFQFRIGGVF